MISVIFSTFNGEKTLPLMLEALLKLNTDNIEWELIAVNNNSVDNTQKILEKYLKSLPLHILFEATKGKNHALNYALKYAEGELIIFTDDDVLPDPNWLINICMVTDAQQSYAIFGGKIEPYWTMPPNLWNTSWISMGIVYAISSSSNITGEISAGYIWGPNMVIRRSIFDEGYRFNTAIGPDGTSNYAMGSETSFTLELEQKGYKCWFETSWVVKHIIKESQMSQKWVLSRASRFGRGEAKKLNFIEEKNKNVFLFGAPRHLYRKLLQQYIMLLRFKLINNKELFFRAQWDIKFTKGLISEIRKINYMFIKNR